MPHSSRLLCVAFLGLLAAPPPARACMAVACKDEKVQIQGQSVVVAWNAQTKREDFIRQADFAGTGADSFGFLVPTPTQPELAEAPDALFDRLKRVAEPHQLDVSVSFLPLFLPAILASQTDGFGSSGSKSLRGVRASVRVLDRQHVAGFDAAVLEADDAKALVTWLGQNGFAVSDEVPEWVKPYVDEHWKVTAFKFAARDADVTTSAIRMSFHSDAGPLFPFRVPPSQRTRDSRLRIYFVGDERVDGRLGGGPGAQRWLADIPFTSRAPEVRDALRLALPKGQLPDGDWLTVFDDLQWPSGGDDLFFDRAPEQAVILPPPILDHVIVPVPADATALLVLAVGFLVVRRRLRGERARTRR